MKPILLLLIALISFKSFAQQKDTIRLSEIKLCDLTLDDLKLKDPEIKEVSLEEMNLCSDGFVEDSRFENRIGYTTKLYPGVIFQKYQSNINTIAKIHLTKEFKGYLPDKTYLDLEKTKAKNIIEKYEDLDVWTSRGCSDYLGINQNKEIYFYVELNKSKTLLYPIDGEYYSEQSIVGIDIVSDCYSFNHNQKIKNQPLFIIEGKEVNEDILKTLNPDDIKSINVLKDKSAIDKYGEKGENGVIEIYLKKK